MQFEKNLAIGDVVPKQRLDQMQKIAKLHAPVDAAESALASVEEASYQVKSQVLIGDNITDGNEVAEIEKVLKEARKNAIKAKAKYAIALGKQKFTPITSMVESPVNFNRSELKTLPLSSPSGNISVRSFSLEENDENAVSHLGQIREFITAELKGLSHSISSEAVISAQQQATDTLALHTIENTTVIVCKANLRNALLFMPLHLDPDKTVRAWNATYPDSVINTNDMSDLEEALGDKDKRMMYLVSGQKHGALFIGLIHELKEQKTLTTQDVQNKAQSAQAQLEWGAFIASASGGIGVDSQTAESIKSLASKDRMRAICNITTRGYLPKIVSTKVNSVVKSFAEDISPARDMELLLQAQNSVGENKNSLSESAQIARTGQALSALQTQRVESAISAVSELDVKENSVIGVTSVMSAFENFVETVMSSDADNVGFPSEQMLKPITKEDVCRIWLKHYYPNKYNRAGSLDDSGPEESEEDHEELVEE
ncbi:MAG: hypothetical protein ABW072_11270 [Sedimenticola sp.]